MKRTILSVMVSTLVLVGSTFASGVATAHPSPTRIPRVANGTYHFILNTNQRTKCIVSHGVGNQLRIGAGNCVNIKISSAARHTNQKFFSIGGHCIAGENDNRVRLTNHRCSYSSEYDIWVQTSGNPDRFSNFGNLGSLGTLHTTGNSRVVMQARYSGWVLSHWN